METVTHLLIAGLETLLISGVLGLFISRREEKIKKQLELEFSKQGKFFDERFSFKMRTIEELLAPISLQFSRSLISLQAYKGNDAFRELILKSCNETILNLLLTKGYLIPSDLMPSAVKLIQHYDEWLQAYHEMRVAKTSVHETHVFTYNFPKEAEQDFLNRYRSLLKELSIEQELNQATQNFRQTKEKIVGR